MTAGVCINLVRSDEYFDFHTLQGAQVKLVSSLRQPMREPGSGSIPIWTALFQKSDQVVSREPGERFLGHLRPAVEEAKTDHEFAWLSVVAYGRSVGDKKKGLVAWLFDVIPGKSHREVNPNGEAILSDCGWTRWPDFAPENVLDEMKKSHLRVEVWTKKEPPCIVAAFGGTVFTSGKDWKSNLRWFLPKHKDEYSQIVDVFGPAFVDELCRRMRESEWAYLRNATMFSTGHSLGGGLAQQFAYSLPPNPEVPRVAQVFAFDPSPVTGFYSVDKARRDKNKYNLRINRNYERGEILAILRSLMSFLVKPSAKNPSMRGVRYSLFFPADPIRGHSILELASKIEIASSGGSA
jgi:hypothetical protein